MSAQLLIRTSDSEWLAALSRAYRHERSARIIDDARLGVNPVTESLWDMAKTAKLSAREIAAVCVGCGMAAAGVGMVVLAFVDPEPTSKLGLLVAGGIVLALCGGGSAIQVLTQKRPPRVRVGPGFFDIDWSRQEAPSNGFESHAAPEARPAL